MRRFKEKKMVKKVQVSKAGVIKSVPEHLVSTYVMNGWVALESKPKVESAFASYSSTYSIPKK